MREPNLFLVLAAIVQCCIVLPLAYSFLRRLPRGEWMFHPFFWMTFFYCTQVILRMFVVGANVVVPLVDPGWGSAVIYSYALAFYIVYYLAAKHMAFKSKLSFNAPIRHKLFRPEYAPKKEYLFLFIVCVLYLICFAYAYKSGAFRTLGDARGQSGGVLLTFARAALSFQYLIIGLVCLLYNRDRKFFLFLILIGVLACMGLTAFLSGSRGILLSALFAVMMFALARPKRYAVLMGVAAVVSVVFLGLLLSFLRHQNVYMTEKAASQIDEKVKIGAQSLTSENVMLHSNFDFIATAAGRFSFYSDTWIQFYNMRWNGGGIPRHRYPLGSISDVKLMIPGFLWRNKSSFTYNNWTASLLLPHPIPIDYPIGIIGEAYVTFDIAGVLMAFVYAYGGQFIYRRWRMHPNLIIASTYFLFLFLAIIHGPANLMAGVPPAYRALIILAPIVIFLTKVLPFERAYPPLPEGREPVAAPRGGRRLPPPAKV